MDLSDRARVLSTARLIAAALGAGPLLLMVLAGVVSPAQGLSTLVVPAGVLGLVAPAIAWRLQARVREGASGRAEEGRRAYLRSLFLGLAVTEGAAILGGIVWLLTREIQALIGLPMHLVMVGALWPTEERVP
ncbi:MAG TPA: hypothetical protein VFV75_14325 [Candidatus Polarisedimenticolaceae bacterium]|nr:hypothetical protein [Candidatus Polarisedimenticolaceae bacterium]